MAMGVIGRTIGYAGLANAIRKVKASADDTVRKNARLHLAQRMGKLRGLPQKIGQVMSMADDADQADAFGDLTDSCEPLPFGVVEEILTEAWGLPLSDVVADIDTHGRAASLGQVHRGRLKTGEPVAIKVAYPGIRQAVMHDMKMLGWLSVPVGDLRRGFDTHAYRQEIVRDLNEELDYRKELENQAQFARFAAKWGGGVVVPSVFREWSRENVLVSTWEDGDTIEEVRDWPAASREELARRILKLFLFSVFENGVFHADPHPGNYRFRACSDGGPQIVLYDYGSVARLSVSDRLVLLKLLGDTTARDGNPIRHLTALGFNTDLLEPIQAKLPAVCSVLFEPFANPMKFDLSSWNRTDRMNDILGDDRWNFRMAGPAKLLLLMRAFRGVLFYLERMGEPVSWERILSPLLQQHAGDLADLDLPPGPTGSGTFGDMAKHLRIEVFREGTKKVSLTLPAGAIDDLAGIMDEDLLARVQERGIDLEEMVRDVRRSGYLPADLFTHEEPELDKLVKVWIE